MKKITDLSEKSIKLSTKIKRETKRGEGELRKVM